MVSTRSQRREAGEGVGITRQKRSSQHATAWNDEPSNDLPKAKRQKTTANNKTTAARNRKARALKPVTTNANSKSNVTQTKAAKAKVKATVKETFSSATETKPAVVRSSRRGRTSTQKQHLKPKTEVQPQRVQHEHQQPEDDRGTTSTRATHADADIAATTQRSSAITKSASTSSYQNGEPDNIDDRDSDDPLCVTDYVEDMYRHFRMKEESCSVDCMYMGRADEGKQPNISESMRCILVDWLIEVHYKFKLFPETLYLTVNILDRFLSQTNEIITKRDLQLVGVTSLLLSAKYEEMYVPELRDLTYICDGAYTEAKILRMEEKILKTLQYNVTVPTPHTFLIRFLKAAHADKLMAQLACFLLDGTLLSLEKLTCRWRPSQLAAAAILLARRQLGRHNWSPTLVAYSLYREEDVMPVAQALLQNKHQLEENRELMALAKKYSKTKYGKVSHIIFLPLESPDDSSTRASDGGDDSIAESDL